MRNIFLIFVCTFLSFFSYGFVDNSIKKNANKLLIGRWVLTTDKNLVMDIGVDSIIYYYNGLIDISNPIFFVYGDSLANYYDAKHNRFDFMNSGDFFSQLYIREYDSRDNDTIDIKIVYVCSTGIDIISRNRSVSFNRINSK